MLGQGGVGMGGDLRDQRGVRSRPNLGRAARPCLRGKRTALGSPLRPAPHGARVDADPGLDLSHGLAGVDGGQGAFTEIG